MMRGYRDLNSLGVLKYCCVIFSLVKLRMCGWSLLKIWKSREIIKIGGRWKHKVLPLDYLLLWLIVGNSTLFFLLENLNFTYFWEIATCTKLKRAIIPNLYNLNFTYSSSSCTCLKNPWLVNVETQLKGHLFGCLESGSIHKRVTNNPLSGLGPTVNKIYDTKHRYRRSCGIALRVWILKWTCWDLFYRSSPFYVMLLYNWKIMSFDWILCWFLCLY